MTAATENFTRTSSLQRRKSASHGRPSMPAPGLEEEQIPTIQEAMRVLYGTEGVIPRNRAVIGSDLDRLRTRLGGLTITDACWLFGIQKLRWHTLVKSDEPLTDVTLAILCRTLDTYPELCPIKPSLKASWVFKWLKDVDPQLDQRQFSLLLGREKSAAHRWLKLGSAVSPKVDRMFHILTMMILSGVNPGRSIEPLVMMEAQSRGLDISKEGMWSTPDARVRPKRRKPGERNEA